MLFTDVTSQRAVKALEKAGFWVSKKGKHIGMSDGRRKLTIPRTKRLNIYIKEHYQRCRSDGRKIQRIVVKKRKKQD